MLRRLVSRLVALPSALARRQPAVYESAPGTADARGRFWAWFADRAPALRAAPLGAAHAEIHARLSAADPRLFAELGADDARMLVVTADGNAAHFPAVEAMVAQAPAVAGWRIVAFRQPRPLDTTIEVDGAAFALDDIRFVATPDGARLDVVLYVPGLAAGDTALGPIAFIALDHAIGEHATATRIGAIAQRSAAVAPPAARPLGELATVVAATPR